MGEILAKLTNLTYDIFGILLPGLILNIFVMIWFVALGPLVPASTNNVIPELNKSVLLCLVNGSGFMATFFYAASLFILWYLLGHMLHWSGKDKEYKTVIKRIIGSLIFDTPLPKNKNNEIQNFDSKLEPLFKVVQKEYSPSGNLYEWGQLFQAIKCNLAQKLTFSRVNTYQNKYTLHRSITVSSTILFWLSFFGLIVGMVVSTSGNNTQPHMLFLFVLLVSALTLVWAFSGSYLYNWTLFGNTIVTEAYSLLQSQKNDPPEIEKSSSH